MRHFIANIATYTIGILLILGTVVFAWIRSSQIQVSDESTLLARFEPRPEGEFEWQALGEASYRANCVNCHRGDGAGWDQYPGVGHTARLAAAPGGREYLIDVHLYGLTSDRWRAPMPPMGHMHDVELAAVLNHLLTNYGNQVEQDAKSEGRSPTAAVPLYRPAEIAARRDRGLRPADIEQTRPDIGD